MPDSGGFLTVHWTSVVSQMTSQVSFDMKCGYCG